MTERSTFESDREWQNGFEQWNQCLSAIGTHKSGSRERTHVLDYVDIGELLEPESDRS